jgi:hypothetical protein
MRTLPPAPFLALLLAACGGSEGPDEPIGDPSQAELANRIENVAFAPTDEEEEKAAPRRLGVLEESALPPEFRAGRICRLTEGTNLLLVAAEPGALATVDGRTAALRIAGPVGPSGGFFEAPGITVSIGLKPPPGAVPGSPATRAGVTVGGDKNKPIQRHEALWICGG